MKIASKYNPIEVEDKWYKYWLEKGFFHSTPDDREAYSIVIPPPNVTGVLHMGHILTTPSKIFWCAVHECKAKTHAGCLAPTTPLLLLKQR